MKIIYDLNCKGTVRVPVLILYVNFCIQRSESGSCLKGPDPSNEDPDPTGSESATLFLSRFPQHTGTAPACTTKFLFSR
jgi:hypothetical protein